MFLTLFGLFLTVITLILQMNGVVINWELSATMYAVCTVGIIWTFLAHAVPHYGKIVRVIGASIITLSFGALAAFGTFRQYCNQHSTPVHLTIDAPNEHLLVNEINVEPEDFDSTNSFETIPIGRTERMIRIATLNVGEITSEHCNVDFSPLIPLSETNLFDAQGHWREAQPIMMTDGNGFVLYPHWICEARYPNPPNTLEPADPIFVSTNYGEYPIFTLMRIYSDNSPMKEYKIRFIFQ